MAQSTAELRNKNHLTPNDLTLLMGAVFDKAASSGMHMNCTREQAIAHYLYCCRLETIGYNSWVSNGSNVGLIQCGVDILIESSAIGSTNGSEKAAWRKKHPVTWLIFPAGLHPVYKIKNRSHAVALHKSMKDHPRYVEETASDALVSTCVYLDTIRFAYDIFLTYFHRAPTHLEIYAFNCMGWSLCAAYAALLNGQRNAYCVGKLKHLDGVKSKWKGFLAYQSAKVQQLLAGGLGNLRSIA